MNLRQQREAIMSDLATIQNRVDRLRKYPQQSRYDRLSDDELRWLALATRKALGELSLQGVDLFDGDALFHARGGSEEPAEKLDKNPIDLERLSKRELVEYRRVIDLVDALPPDKSGNNDDL